MLDIAESTNLSLAVGVADNNKLVVVGMMTVVRLVTVDPVIDLNLELLGAAVVGVVDEVDTSLAIDALSGVLFDIVMNIAKALLMCWTF
ncbi:hypothetical protein WICMUC_000802 [Wickerhamomyces mucosus]|uniref:Uncharacterized protein n=1 Tax=Wickerhamomyces mucosus TaxID=1378264 RepID=A0A9P8PXY6_9ASCO|nr:hypothetical protein WICMUC_000802 [Wickerhamomyces mucosus]